jgi:hypothetical protein
MAVNYFRMYNLFGMFIKKFTFELVVVQELIEPEEVEIKETSEQLNQVQLN